MYISEMIYNFHLYCPWPGLRSVNTIGVRCVGYFFFFFGYFLTKSFYNTGIKYSMKA